MSIRQLLGALVFGVVLSVAGGNLPVSMVQAAESGASVDQPGSIRQTLEQQLNKRVKLKLVSGQDVEGVLVAVGDEVVTVNELVGMEFFGATVRLDQIAAVIVRTKSQ